MHSVNIKYFASIKDFLGKAQESLTFDKDLKLQDIKSHICQKYSIPVELSNFRVALNFEFCSEDILVKNGDEVAILPPVTGG